VKPEDQTHVFDMIRQSAEAQRQLIEDLLDVSRMISGKMRLRVTEAELAPLVRAAVDATRPMAEAKDVRLELSLGGDAGRARVDPDRIQQVVWNLLNNAVKFTDAGGRVRVGLGRAGSTVRVEVADTGRGISAEFLPHVFDRFRQADASLTRTEGGLGLGLAIARQLVELHGGTIRARSPGLGKGSTFTVELPAGDGRVEAGGERRAGGGGLGSGVGGVIGVGGAFAASPVLAGLRVLVVEDEANTRTVIRWLLEQCAADVTAVESAALAVAAFREGLARGRFDVIVSDVGMPVQDGYELLREIREMERQRGGPVATPALALTAYARDEDRARAEAAGFQAHLAKPVEPKALVEAVARLAGR